MGGNRCEIGLLLRKSILVNSMLFSMEVMSGIREKDLVRMEQVDSAMLRSLTKGHCKAPSIFAYLETGSLKLRHILMIKRLMFHKHLLHCDPNETLRKIYEKQKSDVTPGDWYQSLLINFKLINEELDEGKIMMFSKQDYKKMIEEKVKIEYLCSKNAQQRP